MVDIKFKRGTDSNLTTINPIALNGEPIFNVTNGFLKIGDGTSNYNSLNNYFTDVPINSVFYGRLDKQWVEINTRTVKEEYVERGLTSNQSIPNATETLINWTQNVKDDYGMWSPTNPSRITIPTGVTLVRVTGSVYMEDLRHDRVHYIQLLLNGNILSDHTYGWRSNARTTTIDISSKILPVSVGDYFEVRVYQNSGGARNALLSLSYIQVEVKG
jgi:hypothetical protein